VIVHQRISQNGRIVEASKARMNAISPASLYGHGVFTTIAIHYGRPFLWSAHWQRLKENGERLRVDFSGLSEEETYEWLTALLKSNKVHTGRARITVLAREITGAWNLKGMAKEGADVLIMTGDARAIPDEGLALTVSPYRINSLSPLAGIKSVNYLDHILAWEEARERDFNEAVCFNERGEVVSAARANIFWVTEGQIRTPTLSTGALAGTTRRHVIELAEELSIPHIEGVYDLSDLADADEIFLTSAGLGITPIHTFDFRNYQIGAGSIMVRLREALHQSTLRLSQK
jgi:4-amino-4-deoxychorismate lyase